jgi:hypothetical protein
LNTWEVSSRLGLADRILVTRFRALNYSKIMSYKTKTGDIKLSNLSQSLEIQQHIKQCTCSLSQRKSQQSLRSCPVSFRRGYGTRRLHAISNTW